jgi:hypothetical protein
MGGRAYWLPALLPWLAVAEIFRGGKTRVNFLMPAMRYAPFVLSFFFK